MTKKSPNRLKALSRRANVRATDSVVADAKLGIVAVAMQTLSAQMGLSAKELLVVLVGLYFPGHLLPFIRRANSGVGELPSARLTKMLAGFGYVWDDEAKDFIKKG